MRILRDDLAKKFMYAVATARPLGADTSGQCASYQNEYKLQRPSKPPSRHRDAMPIGLLTRSLYTELTHDVPNFSNPGLLSRQPRVAQPVSKSATDHNERMPGIVPVVHERDSQAVNGSRYPLGDFNITRVHGLQEVSAGVER